MITITFSRVKLTYSRRPGRCWASVKQQRAWWDPPQLGCKRSHRSSDICALDRDGKTIKTGPYQPWKALRTAQVMASGGAISCFQKCNPSSPPKFQQTMVKVRSLGIYSTFLCALVEIDVSRMLQVVFFTNKCVKTSLHFGHRSNGNASQSNGTVTSAVILWIPALYVVQKRRSERLISLNMTSFLLWNISKTTKPKRQKNQQNSTSCFKIKPQIVD